MTTGYVGPGDAILSPYYGTLVGSAGPAGPVGNSASFSGTLDAAGNLLAGWTGAIMQNGVTVAYGSSPELPVNPTALAASFGVGPGAISYGYPIGVSAGSAGGGAAIGTSAGSGGGLGSGGGTQPGGTVQGAASNLLKSLSHTTAGINWSQLALWAAILAGGYIALSAYTGGGKRRRR